MHVPVKDLRWVLFCFVLLFSVADARITGRRMSNGCEEKCRVINGHSVAKSLTQVEHLFTCTFNGQNILFPIESQG